MNDEPLRAVRRKRRVREVSAPPPPARYQAFIDGTLTVADLDDEEVFKMQLKDKNGRFSGPPPKVLPAVFLEAIRVEQMKRHHGAIAAMVDDAHKTIARLMHPLHVGGPGDGPAFKAAQFVLERYAGKTPDALIVKAEVKTSAWEDIEGVTIDVEEEDDDATDKGRAVDQ